MTLRRLLLLALLVFAAGLGLRDPWPADEPRFALIARDMVLSGDWLIPRVGGEAYSDKPPLFMWLVAGAYWLTGNLRIASLLPSLLAGVGMLALVYDLARRLWGLRAAWLAGLLLVLTVQFSLQARTAQLDALVSFWITLGVYGLLRHLLLGPQWGWYFLAWFAAGLGVITKGVGFLPLLMLLPWAFVRRRWPGRLPPVGGPELRWWLGPLFMLAAVVLWLGPMLLQVEAIGSPELAAYRDDILLRQTAERYLEPWGHIQPFWYYALEVVPWAWAPLSFLLPWLAPAWWRKARAGDPAILMLLGWAACVLLFFSLTPGKRHVYILPALPAVALAAAPWLDELLRRRDVRALARAAVWAAAVAGMALLAWVTHIAPSWGFDPRYVVVAVTALAIALALAARRIGSTAALVLLIIGSWQIYGWWAAPLMDGQRSGRDLMARVAQALPPGSELGLAGWREQFLLHVDRPVSHFGFRRSAADELRDAAAWLEKSAARRLLIPAGQMAPCLAPKAGRNLGLRHRREWRLVGREALTGACPTLEPLHVRRYDPATGGLLAAREREPDAAADQECAAQARDQPRAAAREEVAGAAGEEGVGAVGYERDRHRGDAQEHDLPAVVAGRVDELRDEGAEPEHRLRVGEDDQQALQEEAAARRRRAAGRAELVGRAQQLPAQPHEVEGAGDAQPVEPRAHHRDHRAQPDDERAHQQGEAELGAGDVGEPGAGAVGEAVGDDHRHRGPGDDGDHEAGDDVGEVGVEAHRPSACRGRGGA